VTLRFAREWGFVVYAAGILLVSAFTRKFYCRYLCPLGAALTFPSKFRIFEWLRRYKECGRPCQICRSECEVRAIRSTGEINPNECHYCLDCQVTYWNAYKCPPLVRERRKRESRGEPESQRVTLE
jgi:polyferredoxin